MVLLNSAVEILGFVTMSIKDRVEALGSLWGARFEGVLGRAVISAVTLGILSTSLIPSDSFADTRYASKERGTLARAHMSRARALLVEALAEFEESRKYARPDLLIDSEDWRLRVVSLTEQLNRVIDPRPRVTREGAVFRAPPRLIKRERDELPPVVQAARSRSDFGERERMQEKQEARARFYEGSGAAKEKAVKTDKAETAKVSLPEEFALPEVPVVKKDSESVAKEVVTNGSKKEGQVVFPNELMPDITKDKVRHRESAGKETDVAKIQDIPALERPVQDYEPVDVRDDEEDEYEEVSHADEAKSIDSANQKGSEIKGSAADSASFTALPGIISDDEVGAISPEVAEKQLTEDEELTKRLEESISKRLKKD